MKYSEPASLKHRAEPLRLVALSDGLFATVLTLLVLDLRTPASLGTGSTDAASFLRTVAPHLFSYLLTFFVAGVYWMAHHRDFDYIVGYDRTLLSYNLLFLLFVGLFPFTTAALALGGFSSGQYPFYWAVYAADIAAAGLMLALTWLYAASHGQIDPALTNAQRYYVVVRQLVTPGVFLLSIVSQFLFPRAIIGPYTLLLVPAVRWLLDQWLPATEAGSRAIHPALSERLWRAGTIIIWLLLIAFAIWAWNL